ncbi:ABC transporter ATP-binding protein [Actinoplanes awajinensis]|uniref:Nitrate ABC transporter ATP-binding protein n=1 Tax=Actinoplanes awajinensis subsp. mycoplanecinus TaxID=135947 RepID=A0A101JG10_9ACTN|nr:ABC transporter ATP-binding protein [Actinoplanes awajinensis]KUL26209.1 nitrate ABC transporter ATP-binding protein [Actinoplanes awajinensis subsp. mycoplanecinus]
MTAVLEVRGLTKRFVKGDADLLALRDVDLTVPAGAFLVLLGRRGCGTSTLLNLLAGLTLPTGGEIRYRGAPVTGPRVEVGYLSQHDTLLPWRDVRRNVEMPLELRGDPAPHRERAARELIRRVGLAGHEGRYPRELSGGTRRRAMLARLLAGGPETLLLDEPFSALDAPLRAELQADLLRLWQGSGQTVVFVTHDVDEALTLADRVVVLGGLGRTLLDTPIPLPRPRDPADPRFTTLRRALSAALL